MMTIDRELATVHLLHEELARAQQPMRLGEAQYGTWIPELSGALSIALRARRALARIL
jgi:hypothetical protein